MTYTDVLALLLSDSPALDLADRWLLALSEDYSVTAPLVTR